MKVSIIMPCFNVEKTLARALDSIFMQKVDFEYEVIIVDDASVDQTLGIAKKYLTRYPQIRIICNDSNKGNAHTYYTGLCAARGEYICVLDGDDYYTIPDKLQRQVDFLDADIDEEYVGTATHYIIDFGNNMVSIPPRSNFKWMSYADFMTSKTDYYHTSTYMYRNIFRNNVPSQIKETLYRGDTPRTTFHLQYSGKKIRILDFVGSVYTYEFNGIWSGLKRKEQYEYQISYLKQHRENVSTEFERVYIDRKIEICRDMMKDISDDFRRYPSMTIDEALKYISEYAGEFAFAQKDFVLQHAYFSAYIDTLCATLGYVAGIRNPQYVQKEANQGHLCIVNGILNPRGGGIFTEIEELIDIYADKKVFLIVTQMNEIPAQVIEKLGEHSNVVVVCPPPDCSERLMWFREQIAKIAPYRTYYYCSHSDSYGVALAQQGCCENITLFSFDHGYLCGISNPNLGKIVAKRPVDYMMLKKKFKEKVIFIPAWTKRNMDCVETKYCPFKEHDKLITACGAARYYKVDGKFPCRYIDMVITLLKATGGVHYHFGELPEDTKKEIYKRMDTEKIETDKFIHIPWAESIPRALLEKHIDVFLEPFSVVSYKLTLDVLSVGVPVIACRGNTRMSITDFLPKDNIFWKELEELGNILTGLSKIDLQEQSAKAVEYFERYHNVDIVGRMLIDNVGLPEPEKYVYPDNTLIDITDSFRLFGMTYKIDVMSKADVEKTEEVVKNSKKETIKEEQNSIDKEYKSIILQAIEKTLKRTTIQHLDYHITEHCNLNCVGCSTFAPLAKPCFADLESFKHDMENLYRLVGNAVQQIHLLGGEPLLHPKVEQFAEICRSIFAEARIDITTNGLLVADMPDEFWITLKKNNIAIKYTQYPLNFDYQGMVKYVEEKGVYVFSAGPDKGIKCFRRTPLNRKGIANINHSFIQCPYTDCAQLRDGKLYHCPASAFSYLLNRKIEEDNVTGGTFTLSEGDYIDLSEARTKDDVFQFLSNAIPFCQYCDMDKVDEQVEWRVSSGKLSEWVEL